MAPVAIPAWSALGVLPPIQVDDPTGPHRSPYRVSLVDMVTRFASTAERRRILDGLLRLRSSLHAAGLVRGFQWLNGSFLEYIEMLESRPPGDVDVVTFVEVPAGFTINDENRKLFEHDLIKSAFLVDHYFVELNLPGQVLVAQAAYWYSVWSHRRTQLWKGFLEIDLDPTDDALARANVTLVDAAEEAP
jgi:hypothetical protein